MGRLRGVWQAQRLATFDSAMRTLAESRIPVVAAITGKTITKTT